MAADARCRGACPRSRRCRSRLPLNDVPLEASRTAACSPPTSRRCAPSRRPTCRPWTAMPCARDDIAHAPPGSSVIGEVAAGRSVRGHGRHGRSRAHLHRRRGAAMAPTPSSSRRIRTRDGDTVDREPSSARRASTSASQGLDFQRRRRAASQRPPAHDARPRAGGGDEPCQPCRSTGRPKVAILATGDELVPPGSSPGPGQIVYSNGFTHRARWRGRRRRGDRSRHRARPARRDDRGGAAGARAAAPTCW